MRHDDGQDRERVPGTLIGSREVEVRERFGEPLGRHSVAGDVWLLVDTPPGRLRARCRPGADGVPRVASWTLEFRERHERLSGAARAVGLWPAAAPDVEAADVDLPLVRRPLRLSGAAGALGSLTATVRDGRFDRISVFDEPPDWL